MSKDKESVIGYKVFCHDIFGDFNFLGETTGKLLSYVTAFIGASSYRKSDFYKIYYPNIWNWAKPEMWAAGYGLTFFLHKHDLVRFLVLQGHEHNGRIHIPRSMRIHKVEATQLKFSLPPMLDINCLVSFKTSITKTIGQYAYYICPNSPWPEGTLMARGIKILTHVPAAEL